MRYLVSSLVVLPLLLSCTEIQNDYSNPGYYAPPPPQVEVNPGYARKETRNYHGHHQQRPAPRGKVYHGHEEMDESAQVQDNVHGHDDNNTKVHGHSGNTNQARAKVQNRS